MVQALNFLGIIMKKLFKTYFKIPIEVYVYCEDEPGEILKVIENQQEEILDGANEIFKNAFKSFSTIEEVKNKGIVSELWKNRKPFSLSDQTKTCSQIAEENVTIEEKNDQMNLEFEKG